MKHIFEKGTSEDTLILLHGTGGSETDLLEIAKDVFPEANFLGIKGNQSENGMARFFKRLAPGVFDLENYEQETVFLQDFIKQSVKNYNLNPNKLWVLGYSNGANIALNLLLKNPNYFKGMALMHAMVINEQEQNKLQQTKVFLTSGVNDPIIPLNEVRKLENYLKNVTENLKAKMYTYGHSLSYEEVKDIKEWFLENK